MAKKLRILLLFLDTPGTPNSEWLRTKEFVQVDGSPKTFTRRLHTCCTERETPCASCCSGSLYWAVALTDYDDLTVNMGTRDSHKPSNLGHIKKPSSVGNLQRVADSSPNDTYATVRKENRELRLEIACLRMRLTELEKDHNNFKQDLDKESVGSKFLTSVSKTFVKLNPFVRRDSRELLPSISVQAISRRISGNPESRSGKPKRRRHSMS
jgi:hypothetical protein